MPYFVTTETAPFTDVTAKSWLLQTRLRAAHQSWVIGSPRAQTMVRMKDIANDLGISVMTVLRALRNYPDASAATRAEVLQRAMELNYRPNVAARALVTGRTGLMGLVIPNLVHSFFAQLAVELSCVLPSPAFT